MKTILIFLLTACLPPTGVFAGSSPTGENAWMGHLSPQPTRRRQRSTRALATANPDETATGIMSEAPTGSYARTAISSGGGRRKVDQSAVVISPGEAPGVRSHWRQHEHLRTGESLAMALHVLVCGRHRQYAVIAAGMKSDFASRAKDSQTTWPTRADRCFEHSYSQPTTCTAPSIQ
jgi:hypothetical protein